MEKNVLESLKTFMSKDALAALETHDKTVGTTVSLENGMRLKLVGADYINNIRKYESADAAESDGVQRSRMNLEPDGSVSVDNSYFAAICEGDVRTVSLRTLTSWGQLENCPEGALKIAAGKASAILADLSSYMGKNIEVVAREEWKKGDEHKGREQRFDGNAVAFKVVE